MTRRVPALLLLALVLASPASGTGPGERKQQVDQRLARLHDKIAAARVREDELKGQIGAVSTEMRSLERQVVDVSARLAPLEQDLALHQRQLDRLNDLFRLQTHRLRLLRRQHRLSLGRLALRVVSMYERADIGTLDIVFAAATFSEMLEQVDLADRVRAQDEGITVAVGKARDGVRVLRAHTRVTRSRVAAVTRTIEVRTDQVRALRDTLVSRENALSSSRADKRQAASQVEETLKEMLAESESLQETSADLAAKLNAAQRSSPTPSQPSSSGLIWPASGPVVSPFGYRCLNGVCRMHEGIDMGVGYGTAIHAAASGTVVYAGWEGGYGNLILIDHGGGLATAYAHQSQFAVGSGAHVSQGQVIGYVGCTGHCFGPHLHFEVRVNGSAVDPMGYL